MFSSRKLERAAYDLVAFRFIAANHHPDHDTIASFRRRFLKQIEALFVQVLAMARKMGMLKLGTVALDGTKIYANASRYSALLYKRAGQIKMRLRQEVAKVTAMLEAADQADVPVGPCGSGQSDRRGIAAYPDRRWRVRAVLQCAGDGGRRQSSGGRRRCRTGAQRQAASTADARSLPRCPANLARPRLC